MPVQRMQGCNRDAHARRNQSKGPFLAVNLGAHIGHHLELAQASAPVAGQLALGALNEGHAMQITQADCFFNSQRVITGHQQGVLFFPERQKMTPLTRATLCCQLCVHRLVGVRYGHLQMNQLMAQVAQQPLHMRHAHRGVYAQAQPWVRGLVLKRLDNRLGISQQFAAQPEQPHRSRRGHHAALLTGEQPGCQLFFQLRNRV
ncbi:MAG: hypothetical protein Q7U28_00935 [Aquabacterium sp.]|nr:hypothetical protein [Aquabacterium sp.]